MQIRFILIGEELREGAGTMFNTHNIDVTETICTAIVIATGIVLAAPLMFTASYFVVMFG
jgi:hypothetical protein